MGTLQDTTGGLFGTGYSLSPNQQAFQLSPYIDFPTENGPIASASRANAANYMANNPLAGTGGGALATGRPDFFSWDGMLGGKNADGTSFNGWGGAALGALQGIGSAYMGMKQYGLAKDQLAFSKDAFNKNYALQKSTMQGRVDGKARARYAADPGGSGAANADAYVAQSLSRYGLA